MKRPNIFMLLGVGALALGIGVLAYKQAHSTSTTTNQISGIPNILTVNDQKAGTSILVNDAMLQSNGFIVIKDQSGNILTASPILAAGENKPVYITYSTTPGTSYMAALFADNGDGKYSSADAPLLDQSGNPVTARFRTF